MYAIVATSGKQFRVTEGDRILVDRVPARVGETVRLESVLLLGGDSTTLVGRPFVPGAAIDATVVAHRAGDKIIVFKYRPKARVRRKTGSRALLSELKIAAIHKPVEEPVAASQPEPAPVAKGHLASRKKVKGESHGT